MLRQEIAFHDLNENKSSILATQLSSNTRMCRGITSDKISLLSQGLSGVGLATIISLIVSWKLTLVILLFVPVTFLSGIWSSRSSGGTYRVAKGQILSVNDECGMIAIETIENIKTVASLNREAYFIDEFIKVHRRDYNKKTLIYLHLNAISYAISNCLLFFIQAVAFSFGFYLMRTDGLALSNLYRVYATITFSSLALSRVYSLMPDQGKCLRAAKSVFRIVERKSEIDSMSEDGITPKNDVQGVIKFENVYFNYPTRPSVKVLQGFNLEIKKNQTNALVGSSGIEYTNI